MNHEIEFIIYNSDQEKSKIFYSPVLETAPTLHLPGMTVFTLSSTCKLGLMPENGIAKIIIPKAPHPNTGNGIPRCELYLKVDSIENYFFRAIKAGKKMICEIAPRDWGDKVAYISDLDGHILAFAKKTESY
jgi:uncharacterized glyoxalase superfamily protein PhnB